MSSVFHQSLIYYAHIHPRAQKLTFPNITVKMFDVLQPESRLQNKVNESTIEFAYFLLIFRCVWLWPTCTLFAMLPHTSPACTVHAAAVTISQRSGRLWLIFNFRWCWCDDFSHFPHNSRVCFVLGNHTYVHLHKTSCRSTTCSSCYEWRVWCCWLHRQSYTHTLWLCVHKTHWTSAWTGATGNNYPLVLFCNKNW